MNRSIPFANKYLAKKWEEENLKSYTKRIDSVKPTIKSDHPASYAHLQFKLKKQQLLTDRIAEINRENQCLLVKMNYIEVRKPDKFTSVKKPSLNLNKNQPSIDQINEILKKKISNATTVYPLEKFNKDQKAHEKRVKIHCSFPYTLSSKDLPKVKTVLNKKKVVFNQITMIQGKMFKVKLVKTTKFLIVKVFDDKKKLKYSMEISMKLVKKIIGKSKYYEYLIKLLSFEGEDLCFSYPSDKKTPEVKEHPRNKVVRRFSALDPINPPLINP
ncbi:hypothetical protein SteCoe_15877 [Stentor coeruleus]|uniref:Uncharacterized protein n=1 Tax=Stentor coeruleus TaxID=5963 RepID=A0A1R2C2Q6_9CILI|nr:hypothetical protein SteCoe_15877 [Stentor coeruleus]